MERVVVALKESRPDIVRITLSVIVIGILITASFWILKPFLTALIWAAMIVVTTWPFMERAQEILWGRRGLSVTLMTLMLLMVLIIPFSLAVITVIDRSDEIVNWTKSLSSYSISPPPPWVERVPLVGAKLAASWQSLATANQSEISERLAPHAKQLASWVVTQTGSVMMLIIQFLLTVLISSLLYATGEKAALGVRLFARRLGGQNGDDAVILAARAIRGVALGVVATALIQSLLCYIGLVVAGVPAVALLTAFVFVLCVAQVGPALVLIPVVVWLFWQGQSMWGVAMIVWSLIIMTIDNFIRPYLIRKGVDLPLVLIFAGVIGGLIAFGVIGLFIGPVMLAVTYTLLESWVNRGEDMDGVMGEGGNRN
jgi:predicted PurR-regulated permease PerM